MWRCIQCGEKNEGAYQSCWQCEARKDGRVKPNPPPTPQPKAEQETTDGHPPPPLEEQAQALQERLNERFVCRCCGERQAQIQTHPPLSGFISASCHACSYTELYQAEILLRQGETALDLLFGSA